MEIVLRRKNANSEKSSIFIFQIKLDQFVYIRVFSQNVPWLARW